MHITVAPRVCIGSGRCALAVPDVFDQDDGDGSVVLLDPRPSSALLSAVEAAAADCPVAAISLREAAR
ncbi:ferredoxin [Streptomyces sp. ME08-AFT2]|uniref:ferredoxin n=1 Tax=Streptomyces sp. ME08-AFT2 TaxID=3028683 RepID=UPI0029AE48F5|nr:ferredoxin [Streptomyces sp. ME08-AFT2]MDX3312434.1 ferredoxin [Streptomyces sp. ME08-AFT2]